MNCTRTKSTKARIKPALLVRILIQILEVTAEILNIRIATLRCLPLVQSQKFIIVRDVTQGPGEPAGTRDRAHHTRPAHLEGKCLTMGHGLKLLGKKQDERVGCKEMD